MEEQGNLNSWEDWKEDPAHFPQLRPVSRTPAQGPELHGGRGPLITRCRCPAGVRYGVRILYARQDAWAPRMPPGEPQAWPQKLPLPPLAPTMGPGTARPGPGSLQVNAFCGHEGQEAADSITEKGVPAQGDQLKEVTLPCLVV